MNQSLLDHLEELRFHLIRSLLAFLIALVPSLFLATPALHALLDYACPPGIQLIYTRPMELFFTELELALILGLAFSLPVLSHHLWRFISPGLYVRERQLVARLSVFSCLLFMAGGCFALCLVFPGLLRFSLSMGTSQIRPFLSIDSLMGLLLSLILGFGLTFQLPLVVFGLVRLGLVEVSTVSRLRPGIVTVIFIVSAILTPPDVISQLALGLPTWLLFELSLLCCRRLSVQCPSSSEVTCPEVSAPSSCTPPSAGACSSAFQEEAETYPYPCSSPAPAIRNRTPGRHVVRRHHRLQSNLPPPCPIR